MYRGINFISAVFFVKLMKMQIYLSFLRLKAWKKKKKELVRKIIQP